MSHRTCTYKVSGVDYTGKPFTLTEKFTKAQLLPHQVLYTDGIDILVALRLVDKWNKQAKANLKYSILLTT